MSSATESDLELLIAGQARRTGDTFAVENPALGMPFAHCPAATPALLDEAVDAARAALPAWGSDLSARATALGEMASVLKSNAEELARLLSLELGIPLRDAQGEVLMGAGFAQHRAAAGLAVDVIHDDERQRVRVVRRPVGVVGAIIPWNAPLLICCEKLATALLAGNTVVVKPSPLAPIAVVRLCRLLGDVLPPGVLGVVPGPDELGAALVRHPGVDMISFTGSIATGRAIMADGAARLKRLSLELGGNDAAVVLPDVDVARTAAKLFQGAFYRSGQLCAAIKRVYVHEQIADELIVALAQVASAARVGDPFDDGVVMGPLSNRAQLKRVEGLVSDALKGGATAICGGAPLERDGHFFAPTVLTGASESAAIVAEEQFGPALPVLTFADVDEAVAAANGTEYGLGASVWTDDIDAGVEIAARLDAGSAWVNRHGVLAPEIPFGGMKQSGIGRANGTVGIDHYCELQTISVALPRKSS